MIYFIIFMSILLSSCDFPTKLHSPIPCKLTSNCKYGGPNINTNQSDYFNYDFNDIATIVQVPQASGYDMSCKQNTSITLNVSLNSNNLSLNLSCNQNSIREAKIKMISLLSGSTYKRTVSSHNYLSGALNFSSFSFNTSYKVEYSWSDMNSDSIKDNNEICYESFTFSEDGTVTIEPHLDNSIQNANLPILGCSENGAYSEVSDFQYENGYLEIDRNGGANFDVNDLYPSDHYNNPDMNSYEKWEVCTLGSDCY